MAVKLELINSCLNCDKAIPMDFMICTKKCLHELAECAKGHGVKSNYDLDDVWKK